MASFDERATRLPDPDTRGLNSSGDVSGTPGLIQSGIAAGSELLDFAVRADTRNTLSEFKGEQDELLRGHEQEVMRRSAALQQKSGELDDAIYHLDPTDEVTVRNTISQLEALKGARNIPPHEARMRSEALLRERISQNPHLANELRQINSAYAGNRQALNSALESDESILQGAFEEAVTADFKAASALGVTMDYFREMKRKDTLYNERTAAAKERFRQNSGAYAEFENSFIAESSNDLNGILLGALEESRQSGTPLNPAAIQSLVLGASNNFRTEYLNALKDAGVQGDNIRDLLTEFDTRWKAQADAVLSIADAGIEAQKEFLEEALQADWLGETARDMPRLINAAKGLLGDGSDRTDILNYATGIVKIIQQGGTGEQIITAFNSLESGDLTAMGPGAWALKNLGQDPGAMKNLFIAAAMDVYGRDPTTLTAEEIQGMAPIMDTVFHASWKGIAAITEPRARAQAEVQATKAMMVIAEKSQATQALHEALRSPRLRPNLRTNEELQALNEEYYNQERARALEAFEKFAQHGEAITFKPGLFPFEKTGKYVNLADYLSTDFISPVGPNLDIGSNPARNDRDELFAVIERLSSWAKLRTAYKPEYDPIEDLKEMLQSLESDGSDGSDESSEPADF